MPTRRGRHTSARSSESANVVLNTASGVSVTVRDDDLYAVSRRWRYVMSHRLRATESVTGKLRKESAQQLESIGVDEANLRQLAAADTIEVAIRYDAEHDLWAPRVVPWEQLLSLATWPYRDGPLAVIRRLVIDKRGQPLDVPARRALLVNSAPGPLAATYSAEFESECRFVRHLLTPTIASGSIHDSKDPSTGELQSLIRTKHPDIIHLACVDTYAGWNLVMREPTEDPYDGIFLRGAGQGAEAVSAERLRTVLTANSAAHPLLVSVSTCYSAARVAPMAVIGGARLAIGFSGLVDGVLAEQFFATFYSAWIETGWDAAEAFRRARTEITGHRLTQQGGAAVLWSDVSLLDAGARRTRATTATKTQKRKATARQPTALDPALLEVDCRPLAQLNYSLLHNQRSLFDVFTVKNLGTVEAKGVKVLVQLHVGESSFPWQRTLDVKQSKPTDLRDEVQVPLVAGILRQPREGIRTSLLVEVTLNGREIRRDTFSVTLLSADEWRDDPKEWRWLPCFVLPRDAAVQRVLGCAQPYLRALTDDSACGFDGYQRLTGLGGEADYSIVDTQVRAIWSALLNDLPLSYINPPPTYAAASQRIRTPSQMLADKRATCIDLALLLAACFEYIGIYPVLFLTQGHAFVGYWRSADAHDSWMNFREPRSADTPAPRPDEVAIADRRETESWMVGQGDAFAEILQFVQDSTLVPLEATVLTRLGSFADACETGVKNLNDPWTFDAMIDLYRARRENVTPLPLHAITENRV